jgi:ubiquinone/menaquinone biosynthesis C-methylase UbiE
MSDRDELRNAIRQQEADLVSKYFFPGAHILDVGAGNGFQSALFQRRGFHVDAIDVAASPAPLFSVQTYDGHHIPFPDHSFDFVFTSNVLEHVPSCERLLLEMARVLRRDGRMIHVVPTPTWRIWTSAAHYYRIYQMLRRPIPFRHGVYGNWMTEVYYFSEFRWKRTFRNAQLKLVASEGTGLFYTGYGIPGPRTSAERRAQLARYFGSCSRIYVVEKEYDAKNL